MQSGPETIPDSRFAREGPATQPERRQTPPASDPRLARVVAWYEDLSPDALGQLSQLYAPDARFRDPFNDVQGVPAIRRIFAHMFRTLSQARFVVRQRVIEGDDAFLIWDFHLRTRAGRAMRIHGSTYLHFNAQGQVALHRDYWDASEELYGKLPVLGALMRWLRSKLSA